MENKQVEIYKPSGLLQNHELYSYLLQTSVYPREAEILKELREASATHPSAYWGTKPDAGRLLSFLLKLVNAKKTIEIGVFTGYSLLLTALALPEDGKVVGIDMDRKPYDEVGSPIVNKSGVEHKIQLIESQAVPALDNLLENASSKETFDFAFVDADKEDYKTFHERLLKLIKVGGLILYDNTLWGGSVIYSNEEDVYPMRRREWKHVLDFNRVLASDPRIDVLQMCVGDGVTLCRRLY